MAHHRLVFVCVKDRYEASVCDGGKEDLQKALWAIDRSRCCQLKAERILCLYSLTNLNYFSHSISKTAGASVCAISFPCVTLTLPYTSSSPASVLSALPPLTVYCPLCTLSLDMHLMLVMNQRQTSYFIPLGRVWCRLYIKQLENAQVHWRAHLEERKGLHWLCEKVVVWKSDFVEGRICSVFKKLSLSWQIPNTQPWGFQGTSRTLWIARYWTVWPHAEAECTIEEIYFSECWVGTTMRMLLDQNNREKKYK